MNDDRLVYVYEGPSNITIVCIAVLAAGTAAALLFLLNELADRWEARRRPEAEASSWRYVHDGPARGRWVPVVPHRATVDHAHDGGRLDDVARELTRERFGRTEA